MNKLFSFFKRKRLRTLGDVDNLSMDDVDKLMKSPLTNIDRIFHEQHENKCRKCNGELEKILPETKMGNVSLYECEDCHERIYK